MTIYAIGYHSWLDLTLYARDMSPSYCSSQRSNCHLQQHGSKSKTKTVFIISVLCVCVLCVVCVLVPVCVCVPMCRHACVYACRFLVRCVRVCVHMCTSIVIAERKGSIRELWKGHDLGVFQGNFDTMVRLLAIACHKRVVCTTANQHPPTVGVYISYIARVIWCLAR